MRSFNVEDITTSIKISEELYYWGFKYLLHSNFAHLLGVENTERILYKGEVFDYGVADNPTLIPTYTLEELLSVLPPFIRIEKKYYWFKLAPPIYNSRYTYRKRSLNRWTVSYTDEYNVHNLISYSGSNATELCGKLTIWALKNHYIKI